MNTTVEIYLWGSRIGIIHQDINSTFASFEYDSDFLKSGIEISPITMPLSNIVYEFPLLSGEPFFGLPGLVSDSLPDDFGNKVIKQWLSSKGKSINDFTAIDRLCYTGKRGMGALEYKPAVSDIGDINEVINVSEMIRFASDVLNERASITLTADESLSYAQLVQVGSSAGGARAKALISWNRQTNEIRSGQTDTDENCEQWLMKFDNVSNNGDHGLKDSPEYTLIEFAYYLMAQDAGIEMNECKIYKCDGANHFMTKRFDRNKGEKVHMQSLGALAHINYKIPGLCSYEMASQYMKAIGLSMKEIEQFYRRMVFNCLAMNQDDHVKNISFLMDKTGKWSLAPAYDITFSYNPSNKWLAAHQMSVNGKTQEISIEDLILAGENMGLKRKKCRDIINEISSIVSNFEKYADIAGLREDTYLAIQNTLKEVRC